MNRKALVLALLSLASTVAAGSCDDETLTPLLPAPGPGFDAGFEGGVLGATSSGLSSTGTFGVGGVGGAFSGSVSSSGAFTGVGGTSGFASSSSTGLDIGLGGGP